MAYRKGDVPVLDAIDAVRYFIGGLIFIPGFAAIGVAFIVMGHLAGRLIGVLILSPYVFFAVKWLRKRWHRAKAHP